jgi:hypothetical protein
MNLIKLIAEELFFSRIEARYSTQNRSGYQVVYHTSGISNDDVERIEERLQCFNGSDVDRRLQFFHLPSGKFAFTVSEALYEIDREITDRNGRSGAFVGHCYVISAEDFARINNNPFIILEDDPNIVRVEGRDGVFETTAQGMVDIKEQNRGAVAMGITPNAYEPLSATAMEKWTVEKFQQLVTLAMNASAYVDEKYAVSMKSDNSFSLRDLLAILFHTIPKEQRVHCTFDTFVDGCLSRPGIVWLLGGATRISNARMTQIDIDIAEIDNIIDIGGVESADPKVQAFSMWLNASLKSFSITDILKMVPGIHLIIDAFSNQSPIEEASRQTISSYLSVNQAMVDQQVDAVIEKYIADSNTAKQLAQQIRMGPGQDPMFIMNVAATNQMDPSILAKTIFAWIQRSQIDINWHTITVFSKEHKQGMLYVLAVLLANQDKGLDNADKSKFLQLAQQPDKFSQILHIVFKKQNAVPTQLIDQDTASYIEHYLRNNPSVIRKLPDYEQVKLMRALNQHLEHDVLPRYENHLSDVALKKLQKEPLNLVMWGGVIALIAIVLVVIVVMLLASGNTGNPSVEVTSEVTPEMTSEVTPEVTSEVTPEVTSEVTPEVTSEVTPEVTSEVTPEVTGEVIPEVTSEVTPEVTGEVIPEVTGKVTPEVTGESSN